MNPEAVMDIGASALMLAAKLSAPLLITALVVGFAISLLQSITQVHEQTLSFIPKVVGVVVVIVVAGPWMLGEVVSYTQNLYEQIPSLIG